MIAKTNFHAGIDSYNTKDWRSDDIIVMLCTRLASVELVNSTWPLVMADCWRLRLARNIQRLSWFTMINSWSYNTPGNFVINTWITQYSRMRLHRAFMSSLKFKTRPSNARTFEHRWVSENDLTINDVIRAAVRSMQRIHSSILVPFRELY